MSETIGKTCKRTRAFLREHGITPFREILTPAMFASLAPVPAANTVLIPEVVFWLMATVAVETGATMCSAITTFWKSLRARLNFLPAKPVTEEAFCTARERLPLRFFLRMFLHVAYPYEELTAMYHERWRQETMHREWEYTLQMSNLRSKTCTGIYKEVLVHLTLNNVVRRIMAEASADKDLRPVDLSFLEAKRLIMTAADVMAAAKTECLPRLYRQLLPDLARETILVRPGRSYPRRHDGKPRNKGHGEYAKPAKLPSDGDNDNERTETAI